MGRGVRPTPGATLTWQSVSNRFYFIERATNLSVAPAFLRVQSNLPGQPGTNSRTDPNGPTPGPRFFRIGIQPP